MLFVCLFSIKRVPSFNLMLHYLQTITKNTWMPSLVQKESPCLVSGALLGAPEPLVLSGIQGVICRTASDAYAALSHLACASPWLPDLATAWPSQKGPQAGTLICQLRVYAAPAVTGLSCTPPFHTRKGEGLPSCGVSQHRLLTQTANNPAVDGVGRAAAAADGDGRAAQ